MYSLSRVLFACDLYRPGATAALMRDIATALKPVLPVSEKSLLKQIDELNYARYSKGWVA